MSKSTVTKRCIQPAGEHKRIVRFDSIDIIEIGVVLGDNPSLSDGGPPMSLGWESVRRSRLDLDYYEEYRPKRKSSRRKLIISKKARTKFFLRCGYSLEEIEEAAAISLNYRNQMTLTNLLNEQDKNKNRFASCHECEMESMNPKALRRHSSDTSYLKRLTSYSDDVVNHSRLRASRRLSNEPQSKSRFRMPKRLSIEHEAKKGASRRSSIELLAAPIRRLSPLKSRPAERRNSPTSTPFFPDNSNDLALQIPRRWSSDDSPLEPIRAHSPERSRWNLHRHHSAPITPLQALKVPERSISPLISPKVLRNTPSVVTVTESELSPKQNPKFAIFAAAKQLTPPELPSRSNRRLDLALGATDDTMHRLSPIKPVRKLSPPISHHAVQSFNRRV